MASRPVASRGGLTGAHYGMIAFAVLTVASLGLFIFTLTRVGGAEQAAEEAQRRMRTFGNPPAYYADEARNRNSNVFAVMADDMRKVAALVTGDPEDVGATIEAKADRVLNEVAGGKPPGTFEPSDTLLTAVGQLNRLYVDASKAADTAAANARALQDEVASLTEQLQTKEEQFASEVESLGLQLQQAREDMASALGEKDSQFQNIQSALDASEQEVQRLQRDTRQMQRDYELEVERLGAQISSLQRQMQQFKLSLDPAELLTKADGRILRAVPGSDIVYINLGAADKMKIGMRFEVFSQTGELPEGFDGKASLEVVNVMEDTSECRVMRRTAGQPIVEGDTVVNIAYERGRKPKFLVLGEFDIDYDGETDWNGPQLVKDIVRQWGGQVVDELDESVDFVVVGLPPTIPTFARGQQVSEVVRDQEFRKQIELSEYRDIVERAQKMFIPVITQNPFLFLTGYPGDGNLVQ